MCGCGLEIGTAAASARRRRRRVAACRSIRAPRLLSRIGPAERAVYFPDESLGLELILASPAPPPSDATNYLGGVADVLERQAAPW
jgi:hypothetical protein